MDNDGRQSRRRMDVEMDKILTQKRKYVAPFGLNGLRKLIDSADSPRRINYARRKLQMRSKRDDEFFAGVLGFQYPWRVSHHRIFRLTRLCLEITLHLGASLVAALHIRLALVETLLPSWPDPKLCHVRCQDPENRLANGDLKFAPSAQDFLIWIANVSLIARGK